MIDGVDRPVQELSRVSIPFDRFYMSLENLFLSFPTSKLKELAIISLRGLINARMREVERPWLGGNNKSLALKTRPVNVVVMLWSHESKRPLCREGGFMHKSQSSISEMRLL